MGSSFEQKSHPSDYEPSPLQGKAGRSVTAALGAANSTQNRMVPAGLTLQGRSPREKEGHTLVPLPLSVKLHRWKFQGEVSTHLSDGNRASTLRCLLESMEPAGVKKPAEPGGTLSG